MKKYGTLGKVRKTRPLALRVFVTRHSRLCRIKRTGALQINASGAAQRDNQLRMEGYTTRQKIGLSLQIEGLESRTVRHR